MDEMSAKGGPAGSRDSLYDKPYVDIDEWRVEPVGCRYIHGGFKDTDCRFSFYFPPPERYEGRFFQPLMAVSGIETAALRPAMQGMMIPDTLPSAIDSGAYLVESNQGRTVMFPGDDPTIPGYRASTAVAKYSRVMAAEMYGAHRPYGYVYGGSGGAFKTMACMENSPGVWDGAVPFVHGTGIGLPSLFTVQAHAIRILRDKFPTIVDALEPGGSGDVYAGLNIEECEALAEVTRMGFPPRAWFNFERIARGYTGVFSMFFDNMMKYDPDYFNDFWTVPGYLGANPPESLLRTRIQHNTTISKVVMSKEAAAMGLQISMPARLADSQEEMPAAIQLESIPEGNLQGITIILKSGGAAGHVFYISGVMNDMLTIGFGEEHFQALKSIKAGDEVMVDNSVYLASQTYHRHQVPSPDFYVWDQFKAAGQPIYPQRPLIGPRFGGGTGSIQNGRFAGKIIVVQCLMDEAAYPWQADWYRNLVQEKLGQRLDDQYRLYFVDNAMHTGPWVGPGDPRPVITTRIINYMGVLQQALRDLSDWVEKGLAPPESTTYKVVDGQVIVPPTAAERKGIQPVVTVKVNDNERADVAVGETVEFTAMIEVPPGAGTVVAAHWDFEGAGDYPLREKFDYTNSSFTRMTFKTTYAFSDPGTYFPALRVASHRQGDFQTRFARIQNIGRVRVVVR
ncbi:MAG: hypothetical protein JSV77_02435 [Dehalococcoidales bacterium]|nr:MAG: hypothetical protein JSV77_02435 [Dehalococcoidales bacterium]